MAHTPIYEFDAMVAAAAGVTDGVGLRTVPPQVFAWLEAQALRLAEVGETPWLRLTQRRGRRAVQVTNFVGVMRAPDGYQIEVLPKVGKAIGGGDVEARQLLIEMLRCLGGFRHIQTDSAKLFATRMPLLEVFIAEFLRAVQHLVKRGLRSDYRAQQDNLFALRGKLQMAAHLRHNLCRRDRFFAEFDEFSPNRPENRLLHAALKRVLAWTAAHATDFQQVRLDRGMAHYEGALAWARLILEDESPLTGAGGHHAPSLLFPMEAVFEAFVAKHLARQLEGGFTLRTQARSLSLVRHIDQNWFRLKPDLLVQSSKANRLVLDTKWKLIDGSQATGSDKYGLDQGDFYQLHAYGQNYLDGQGDVVLIYPKTDALNKALPVFEFPKSPGLRLWVLPFCLRRRELILPACGSLDGYFSRGPSAQACRDAASGAAAQEAVLA
jgi:5-methylcytosine-specific restriction enzyme subunit McrC